MINAKSAPRAGENTWLWLIKLITGLLVVILLLVHFIVNHFVAEGALLTYEDVVAYFSNPWIVLMEITFLITVVSHGLIGLRSIILDLNPSRKVMGVTDWVLISVGVVSVGYGIWLALEVASRSS
jgi:succinate dehydrogenase / fumarate reductase membrane anchor subunit